MAEERGHGEPVGEGADHRRLGGGVDEAPHPAVVEAQGGDEDDRSEDEQAGGDEAHAAQAGPAPLVRRGLLEEAHAPMIPHRAAYTGLPWSSSTA